MATRGPDTRMEPAGSSAIYDAFVSYKHGGDKPVASGLQQVLQTLGKSWWRRRTMRVFRDDTTLIPSPALARSIESALSQSRNLILIASPEAAASPWVEKEVAYWLEHRDVERLFIAVTAGDLTWNDAIGDFDWRPDTPLPPILRGRFKHEPLWVDLRPYRGAKGRIGKDDQEFVSRVAGIAAAILGRAKEDLLSEELRQQRRNFAWASAAAAGLAVLAATSIWLAVEAEQQRQAAVAQELEAHRNNTRAQMQLALVNGERSATREALVAALEGVDAARTGGIDLATLEPALYEISAKIPNGLVAAAQVTWPTAAANYLTRSIQFRGRDAVVCMHREQLGGEGKPAKGSEYCVGFGDGKLKLLPGETLGANLVQTEALYLEINKSKTDLNLSIEDFSGNPARPFRTIPSQPFGDHLDSSSFSGKVCPDLKRAVLSVTRWTPEKSGETKDVIGADNYVVTFDTLKVKRIYDDFGIDSVACSPDGRFIAGAPDRGNLAILDIEQDYIAATAAGDLARAAANAPGVAFSDNLALLPSMTQIRGTATRASLKLLAGAWKDSDIRFPTWDGVGASAVALSSDGRYAALFYDNDVLTIWDLPAMGLERETVLEVPDAAAQPDGEAARVREIAISLTSGRTGERSLTCIEHNSETHRLIGTGEHLLLEYDLSTNALVYETPAKYLGKPDGDCEGGFVADGSRQVVEVAAGVRAVCEGALADKQLCVFVLSPEAISRWDIAALQGPCSLGYKSDGLWLCVRGGQDQWHDTESGEAPAIALIDWAADKAFVNNDPFFRHVFDHKFGFSDFTVRRADACQRLMVTYSNFQSGGGAKQPGGAVLLDRNTGSILARVTDPNHPAYCTVGELISRLEGLAGAFTPVPIDLRSLASSDLGTAAARGK